jgi:hypothetical protein
MKMPMPDRPQIDESFLRAIQNDDSLGAVIRAHLHIEAELNQFIQTMVPSPDQLPDLRYAQKVDLACALGLAENTSRLSVR